MTNPDTSILELHKGFALLSRKCPKCGDNLIWNHTGTECGALRCEYAEGGEPYDYKRCLADAPLGDHDCKKCSGKGYTSEGSPTMYYRGSRRTASLCECALERMPTI